MISNNIKNGSIDWDFFNNILSFIDNLKLNV